MYNIELFNSISYLVKAGLTKEVNILSSQIDWNSLCNLCEYHGISGLCYDGLLEYINKDKYIIVNNKEIKQIFLKWYCQTNALEIAHKERYTTLKALTSYLSNHGVKVMVLKGEPLCQYYPNPNRRPIGDIDIFPFGHYTLVNDLVSRLGISIRYENSKHSVFKFYEAIVENHKSLFDTKHSKIEMRTEEFSKKYLYDSILTKDGFYIPNHNLNYLFLLRHLGKHFGDNVGISFRQLVDLALFLDAERDRIDIKEIHSVIRDVGLVKINDIFIAIASDITGKNLDSFYIESIDFNEKNLVICDIIKSNNISCNGYKKILNLITQRWKYALLPENFSTRIKRGIYRVLYSRNL